MAPSAMTQPMEYFRPSRPLAGPPGADRLQESGWRWSPFHLTHLIPGRAALSRHLSAKGMTVDLICLGSEKLPEREILNGIDVLRIPVNKEERGGKLKYGYRYASFILFSSLIFALRSLRVAMTWSTCTICRTFWCFVR